jgi:hypothetical protein
MDNTLWMFYKNPSSRTSEARSGIQGSSVLQTAMDPGLRQDDCVGLDFDHSDLFRISSFGFRI